jgi:hypothetical protein
MRERPTLSPPGDLTGFPASRSPARLHRVCRSVNGTWWFSSDGSGRFDLEAPEGTCYFATDLYAAIREASRLGPVTPQWMADREARVVAASDPKPRLAATTRSEAGRFGVTAELVTLIPYDLPRRWAAAFRDHRFDGIRHQLRHDSRARPSGVSLFGPSGAGSAPDGERRSLEISDLTAAGVRVLEPPHSAVLTIVRL